MKNEETKASLNEMKGRLKQKFASLTEDDILLEEGRKEEILGRYQILLYQTREELERIMSAMH